MKPYSWMNHLTYDYCPRNDGDLTKPSSKEQHETQFLVHTFIQGLPVCMDKVFYTKWVEYLDSLQMPTPRELMKGLEFNGN